MNRSHPDPVLSDAERDLAKALAAGSTDPDARLRVLEQIAYVWCALRAEPANAGLSDQVLHEVANEGSLMRAAAEICRLRNEQALELLERAKERTRYDVARQVYVGLVVKHVETFSVPQCPGERPWEGTARFPSLAKVALAAGTEFANLEPEGGEE